MRAPVKCYLPGLAQAHQVCLGNLTYSTIDSTLCATLHKGAVDGGLRPAQPGRWLRLCSTTRDSASVDLSTRRNSWRSGRRPLCKETPRLGRAYFLTTRLPFMPAAKWPGNVQTYG